MAKRDQDEIRRAIQQARQEPLPSYTDEEEKSIVRNVERIKYYKAKGGSHAALVTDTLTKTLNGLPDKDRIWFVLALVALAALVLTAYVVLKVEGVW